MSEQQSVNPAAAADPNDVSPLENFANETAPASPAVTEEVATSAEAAATPEESVPADATPQPVADDPLTTASASADAAPAEVAAPSQAESASPAAAALEAGVKDFVQAFTFVEHGVSQLGEAAKAELMTLARKYL
ncbi:hypothetical protein [Pantoea sp. Acro-807]|uniref:hypothetical protein n=1 Tax=Pantoea sp. Acro-807 TaxID=2608356 RepID=UPI00141A3862|nr:hypothetical protein [Pantoea sp. Acro-807]NIE70451.1 hypothetical protein [Pantoea sp. Acro-807]